MDNAIPFESRGGLVAIQFRTDGDIPQIRRHYSDDELRIA